MSSMSIPITRFYERLLHHFILEHVYMRPEVNSNRFEISNRFEKLFCLLGNFTATKL